MSISAVSNASTVYQTQAAPVARPASSATPQKSSAPTDSVHLSAAAAAHVDADHDGD